MVRTPSDLENYIHFTQHVKATHGSILSFILQHKLHWEQPSSSPSVSPPPSQPTPFANASTYKILRNDWPYGTTPDISHLVVWLKTPLPLDEASGEPTAAAREAIEEFVEQTFRASMGDEDRVVWFRNPSKWQTVRAVEHFHVFVRGAGEEVVRGWTGQGEGEMEVRKWRGGKRVDEGEELVGWVASWVAGLMRLVSRLFVLAGWGQGARKIAL